ncbi:Spinocerebellar ataxia type 10 domain protein [Cryptosporidium meleagridis]|uniref:Spinocerebellar ataxia type 10 domain protein n=1 Tax=Cryptosporidium meleagridis TaxID=93969 RepID=A0A2P4YYB8_9CRYT|nr:Spinocerebellar ataxia type 10 domain protein [Cryptosporidium meleagridis]
MRKKYFDYMEELKLYFGRKDSDSFNVLKEILKRSANEEAILFQCSRNLGTILGLTEVIIESFQLKGFTPVELKLLSELSVLLGIIRNISTISFENRKVISNSKIFQSLNYFIYIKFSNEEKMGLFSLVSYEILKVLENQSPEGFSYNDCHFNEFLLLSCRFLQVLANISIDSDTDFQKYLFKAIYPFGCINIYLFELISLHLGNFQGINIESSSVACTFHLIYNLIKNRPVTLNEILSKKELFGCFIFVAISMYFNTLKHTTLQNLKSSEWIFFFFKHFLSENPFTFRDLYFYNHSEESTIECDASLIYLTMQEPFVKLSMLENNYIDISDAKITKEIIILQKLLSNSIITEHEFKDILLEICVEIETNPNLKQNSQELVDKNIISQIFLIDGMFDTILSELRIGVSYLEQFINLQIEDWSLKLKNKSLEKFSISKLGNIKGWVSVLRISTPKDGSNIDFFSKVNISLVDLLRIMLKFRRHLISSNHIIVEKIKATWKLVSEDISMTSIIQAISTICYGNVQLQNLFSQNQDGISMLIECTTIIDENHPLLREAAIFSLKSIAINNPKVSEIIMKHGKNDQKRS